MYQESGSQESLSTIWKARWQPFTEDCIYRYLYTSVRLEVSGFSHQVLLSSKIMQSSGTIILKSKKQTKI